MSNTWFQFKKFKINQDKSAMKVGIDSVLLGSVANFGKAQRILDIGAGTGLLSFMAEQKTNAQILAIEIEKNAYNQCVGNILLNNKKDNIIAINTSIQDFTNETNSTFNYIISNPPYFENSFKSENISRNTARHADKLDFKELILAVSKLLSKNGVFGLIISYERHEYFIQLALKKQLFCIRKIVIFPNKRKKANRIILEFSKIQYSEIIEEITIRDSITNEYTKQYKKITKDFYLNF